MVEFNAEKHEYTEGGRVLPSVTKVLKAAGLTGDWTGIDPFYAERGTAVHKAAELLDRGSLDPASVDPEVRGFLDAWVSFVRDARPEIHEIEVRFASPQGFAGTADRVLSINGRRGVLDLKTGSPAGWHGVQTAAYAVGLGLSDTKIPRWALYLKADGRFKLEEHTDPADFLTWSAALRLHKWKRRHGIA